jgi:25S rRNA (cytosine2278-C5)-methyltransferase
MVGPTGTVIGCDRDAGRLATLAAAAGRARAGGIVHPLHADFLSLRGDGRGEGAASPAAAPSHPALARVRAILLDPSCSGSGTAAVRGDWLAGEGGGRADEEPGRLDRLAAFQLAALKHALSPAFPAVTRVTYSTCSIHVQENEGVVAAALGSDVGRAAGWRLEAALPAWHRRGVRGSAPGLTDAEADALVRVDAVEDETDGFFVALFVKGDGGGD